MIIATTWCIYFVSSRLKKGYIFIIIFAQQTKFKKKTKKHLNILESKVQMGFGWTTFGS